MDRQGGGGLPASCMAGCTTDVACVQIFAHIEERYSRGDTAFQSWLVRVQLRDLQMPTQSRTLNMLQ